MVAFEPGSRIRSASSGQRRSRPHPNEIDEGLGIQRIEIVEIGDVRQDRHGDAYARIALRRPVGIKCQRIFRRQEPRLGKERHQAERLPSRQLRDARHAFGETASHRRGTC